MTIVFSSRSLSKASAFLRARNNGISSLRRCSGKSSFTSFVSSSNGIPSSFSRNCRRGDLEARIKRKRFNFSGYIARDQVVHFMRIKKQEADARYHDDLDQRTAEMPVFFSLRIQHAIAEIQ